MEAKIKNKFCFGILSGLAVIALLGSSTGRLKSIKGNVTSWGWTKIVLATVSCVSSGGAIVIGEKLVKTEEFEEIIGELKREGRRELKEKEVRHRLAFAQKAQHLSFLEELAAFQEEFGNLENVEICEEEFNDDGQLRLEESEFREQFPEELDIASRKACQKALEIGSTEEEIVRDVLGCGKGLEQSGKAYLNYLMKEV